MEARKFDSLISKPWPDQHENSYYGNPYQCEKANDTNKPASSHEEKDDNRSHVAVLGYN